MRERCDHVIKWRTNVLLFLHVRKGRATRERGAAAFPREREVGAGRRREERVWEKERRGLDLAQSNRKRED